MEAIQPDLIAAIARYTQSLDLSDERARVLASEVSKLNADILVLGGKLRFLDEPSSFAVLLADPPL